MHDTVEIENIEQLRLREGIYDVELREEIRALHVGNSVRLTFRAGANSATGETLLVRITSIRGRDFRGKLSEGPASPALAGLHVGSLVTFTTAHIHSLPKVPPQRGRKASAV